MGWRLARQEWHFSRRKYHGEIGFFITYKHCCFLWFSSCCRPQRLLPFPKNTTALLLAKMERNCKTWSSKLQPKSRSHAQMTPAIRSGSPVPKKALRKLAMKSFSSPLSRWGQLRAWGVCTGLSPRAAPSWMCPLLSRTNVLSRDWK